MQLFGTYTTTLLSEEFAFCLWARDRENDAMTSLPTDLIDRLEEFGKIERQKIWIKRIRLAEAFLEIAEWDIAFSVEADYWRRLFLWSKTLAEQGKFQPGILAEDELFYSRWMTEWNDHAIMERLEEWFQEGAELINDVQYVKGFAEDIVDSYVRLVINTRFSMKQSQLGKLLRFKAFYVHEDWIQRLCIEQYEPGEGRRWEELYEAYMKWKGNSLQVRSLSGRLALRLEPTENPSQWQIWFYWMESTGRLLEWTDLGNHRSQFLQSLGSVVDRHPIFQEDRTTLPFYSEISLEQAYQFLKEIAPALRRDGHAVFAPQSMQRPASIPYRLDISLDARDEQTELGLHSLLSFDFRVSLGDQQITEEELERWSAEQTPLIQANGEWIVLDQKGLKRSIEWLRSVKKKREFTLRDAFHFYAMNGDPDLLPISIQNLKTTGWIDPYFRWLEEGGEIEQYLTPSLFKGELRPYQQAGMSWLIQLRRWNMGACLADDMGLGKTAQFLAYLAHCKEQNELTRPFLLVCPTSVLGNWQKEIQRFTPTLSVLVHHGADRATDETFKDAVMKCDLVLTTYSLAQRDHASLSSFLWDGVVLDEAQHIKNASTLQSQAIRSLSARHRIALTGTPMENRLEELWSIFEFLNPGFLGSQASFRRKFSQPIEKYGDKARLASLKKLARPFLLRRSKSDPNVIRDLPEKIETKEYCPLSPEQASLYKKTVDALFEKEKNVEGFARKGLILSTILRLKQICDHPALLHPSQSGDRSGKMMRLIEMVEEMLHEQDCVLIFTQFTKMGQFLQQQLQEKFQISVPFLHGGIPAKQRERLIGQFQDEKSSPILVLSLKAGGVGLNLTRANRVIHFDRWWNPAVENQATDRAFRIGQTRTVHVHKLISMGTIEEKIDRMIERKLGLVSDIIGTGENWITELDTDELRELLSLHQQLIEDF